MTEPAPSRSRGLTNIAGALTCALLLHVNAHKVFGETTPPGLSLERETVEYQVREGDTCESISRDHYGDARYYYVILEYNPGAPDVLRTTCDSTLFPGAVIRLPRRIPQHLLPPDASVTAVVKKVRSRPPSSPSWSDAHPGQSLFKGWRVNTLEASEAELSFRDRSRVHVRERTLVIIYGPSASHARRRTSKATLERGSLRSRLGELSGKQGLDVQTPTAKAELHGGDAIVSVNQEQTRTTVSNLTGRPARVTDRKGTSPVLVRAGMGTSIRKGRPPAAPRPLLPPPRWTVSSPRLFVSIEGVGQSRITGTFTPVSGASRHRVELTAGPDGLTPFGAATVPGNVSQFDLRGFPPGTYQVSVSAIDEDGLEGETSKAMTLRLAQLTLELSELSGAEIPDTAQSRAEIPRVVAGSRVIAPEGILCAIGEAEPRREVTLSGEGVVSIRCSNRFGIVAPRVLLEVASIPLTPRLSSAGRRITLLRRGEPTVLEICGVDARHLRSGTLALAPGPGLRVGGLGTTQTGCLRATVEPSLDAPPEASVAVVHEPRSGRRVVLGRVAFGVDAPLPQPPPGSADPNGDAADARSAPQRATSPQATPPAGETWGLLGAPSVFGVRDERRENSGFWTSLGFESSYRGHQAGCIASLGLRLSLFQGRLGLEIAAPFPAERDTGGVGTSLTSLVVARSSIGLAVEMATWLPLSVDDSLERYAIRLIPSAHLSYRAGRVTLRTRQGLMADARTGGLLTWASAYAADISLTGRTSMSLEGGLLIGTARQELVLMPSLGLAGGFDLGFLFLSVGLRLTPTEEALGHLGGVAIVTAIRSSFAGRD